MLSFCSGFPPLSTSGFPLMFPERSGRITINSIIISSFPLKGVVLLRISVQIKIHMYFLPFFFLFSLPLHSSSFSSISHYKPQLFTHLSFGRIWIVIFGKELRSKATVSPFTTNPSTLITKSNVGKFLY